MNLRKLFIFSVSVFLFISGCKKHLADEDKLRVENKLNKKIVCVLGYNYPDIKLNFTNKKALLEDTDLLQIDTGQTKVIDTTAGLCKKDVWNSCVKQSLLMLFVFDANKLMYAKTLEDALIERYYFSYTQLLKDKGIVVVY